MKLEIYNLTGQKMKTLFSGILNAGLHRMNWNGQDELGNIAATGFYFVKLSSDEGIRYQSCVLLK